MLTVLNYGYDTRRAAQSSLREFSKESGLRTAHKIVRYYSEKHGRYRYARVLMGRRAVRS